MPDAVRHATVHSFKGLDSKVIFYTTGRPARDPGPISQRRSRVRGRCWWFFERPLSKHTTRRASCDLISSLTLMAMQRSFMVTFYLLTVASQHRRAYIGGWSFFVRLLLVTYRPLIILVRTSQKGLQSI